jgi:putative MFS transporter
MLSGIVESSGAGAEALLSRLEAVRQSRWHLRSRLIVGSATFFDAFDTLALAFVLPVLASAWNLSSTQVGWLIASGYAGQFVGAFVCGAAAERFGRIRVIAASTALMSVVGLLCAMASDFSTLFLLRLLQGVGLGGEMPVAAVYINELSRARNRGRFLLMYELVFPIGLLVTGQLATFVVPTLGWQAMFIIGGAPGLAVAVLVWTLDESPRWLIAQGRFVDATRVIDRMEAESTRATNATSSLAEPPTQRTPVVALEQPGGGWLGDLLTPPYRTRTIVVWMLWAVAGLVTNGLVNWMPTLYRSVYGLALPDALRAATLNNVAQVAILLLCALAIDRTGRRFWTMACLAIGAALLIVLGSGIAGSVIAVIALATAAYALVSSVNAVLYLYTPEIYPTRFRAGATGCATCWVRLSSAVGPLLVGALITTSGPRAVFLMFGTAAVIAAVAASRMLETSNRTLEELSA